MTRERGSPYLVSHPAEAHRGASAAYPLILSLHGAGERGSNLADVTRHGLARLLSGSAGKSSSLSTTGAHIKYRHLGASFLRNANCNASTIKPSRAAWPLARETEHLAVDPELQRGVERPEPARIDRVVERTLEMEERPVGIDDRSQRDRGNRSGERGGRDLEERAAECREQGVPTRARVVSGAPHDKIVEIAEQEGVAFIVMGTHGRGALARFLLGGVADRVVRTAPCAVVTAREGAEVAAAGAGPATRTADGAGS